jgi:hypothetical protein
MEHRKESLLVVTIAINIRNARREEKRPSKGIRQ